MGDKLWNQRNYRQYLQSDHWKEVRTQVRQEQKDCYCCGKDGRDVHHLTYKRLGHELASDLRLLCRGCHQTVHDARKSFGLSLRLCTHYVRVAHDYEKPPTWLFKMSKKERKPILMGWVKDQQTIQNIERELDGRPVSRRKKKNRRYGKGEARARRAGVVGSMDIVHR